MDKIKDYNYAINAIREYLKNYIIKCNLKSLVIGISGGIDSALVAALAKPVCDEIRIPLIGRSISIESNSESEKLRAKKIGEAFCTDFREIDLTEQYQLMKLVDDTENKLTEDDFYKIRMGNIKARMRMIYLYNLAHKISGIVLGTENRTEKELSFFTIGGDEISDFEPIKSLWKTEVYNMTEYLAKNELYCLADVLMSCVECDATDGLGISNTDLDQILPDWKDRHENTRNGYREVDEIFTKYFAGDILMEKSPVIQRYIKTAFKRNRPVVIKRNSLINHL